jgi:hypothetical protein
MNDADYVDDVEDTVAGTKENTLPVSVANHRAAVNPCLNNPDSAAPCYIALRVRPVRACRQADRRLAY